MPVGALAVLAVILLAVALLVFAVSRAQRMTRLTPNRYPARRMRTDLRLEMWSGPRAQYTAAAWEAALSTDAYYTGWWAGMWLLMIGLDFAIALALVGVGGVPLLDLFGSFTWLGAQTLAWTAILSADMNYLLATARTRAARGASTYTEPERRSAGDFVSPLCWVVWIAIIALTAGAYLVFALHGPSVTITAFGHAYTWSRLAIGEMSLLASLFTLLFAGFSVQLIAGLVGVQGEPASLLAAVNDLHRARAISAVTGLPFLVSAIALCYLIPGLANNGLLVAGVWILGAPYIARIAVSRGRLGGRLTGWWWAPLPPRPAHMGMELEGGTPTMSRVDWWTPDAPTSS